MAIVSAGYDGTVDEAQWTGIAIEAGKLYGILDSEDWKVTAGSNPGQLNVAAGTGWGKGVLDTSDAIVSLTQASLPSSGSRWDMVVAHRDWTPPNGQTTFKIITGSATKQLTPRDSTRGVVDDQPLALVQWTSGQTAPTAILDLRCWGGNGGMYAKDDLALGYLDRLGSRVKIGTALWSRELDANGSPVWVNEDGAGPWVNLTPASGWSFATGTGKCRKVARGAMLQLSIDATYTGSAGPVKSDWGVATLPAGYAPSLSQIVTGFTDTYGRPGNFWITSAGNVKVGNGNTGNVVQISGHVVL